LELVIGGTRRYVFGGSFVHFGQKINGILEPGHCTSKVEMEAL